jgi:hypothetical protein
MYLDWPIVEEFVRLPHKVVRRRNWWYLMATPPPPGDDAVTTDYVLSIRRDWLRAKH